MVAALQGDELEINLPGYKAIRYVIDEDWSGSFTLQKADAIMLRNERPVEYLYYQVPRPLATASSDVIYTEEITKSPVTSVRNTLTGRLAGLYTLQSSGQPGADGAATSLRGQNPLVIIDGVVAPLTIFNLEDLESVTVLKDAVGTAMLGVRGSGGALVFTTRKGKVQKQQISFTAQSAIQKPMGYAKTLGAFDYATLYNEALTNDGLPAIYSDADLNAYKTKSDPYGHPDVNWRDEIMKKSSQFNRYTLNAHGGNKFARYYVGLEHVDQSGFFKTADSNAYNTNNDFKSYVIRSNVDVNVNSKTTGGIYLLGRILDAWEPGSTTDGILSSLHSTPNNAYPVLNVNGSYGGTQQFQNNIWAQTIGSGYRQNYKRDMLANFYLKRTLDEITPGLWAQVKASYYATVSENQNRSKSFAVYQMNVSPTGDTTYNMYGTNGTQANSNGIQYQGRSDYEEFSVGYDRTLKNAHGIHGLLMINRDNSVTGSDLPYTISGMSGRLDYNYKGRYVAEAVFGYNGSNRYPEHGDTKRGFFPAVGLGWNLEKENFMKGLTFLNRLKLFSSYGKTGLDDPGYFTYFQRYFDASSVFFGTSAGSNTAITEQTLANPNIRWESANKFNAGIDGSLLNNRLSFTFEYFNNKYYDLLMERGRSIAMIGNNYPRENIGEHRYSGYELKLGWQESVGDFQYFITGNANLHQSEVLFEDEVFRQYDWMKRSGQRVGQRFGYVDDGLFQSATEIDNSATTVGYSPQPGDIKYKDLNSDGVIDQFDIATIGRDKPVFFFGLSVGMQWNGFDFSALVNGVENRDVYLGGASLWAFQSGGFGQAYEDNLNRWTPANAAAATYPRLFVGNNPNNQATSSYWVRNGDYMRLRNIELGYTVPASALKRIKLQSIRVFVSGYNLATISSSELGGRDPEVTSSFSYPIQKLVNFGLNIKL